MNCVKSVQEDTENSDESITFTSLQKNGCTAICGAFFALIQCHRILLGRFSGLSGLYGVQVAWEFVGVTFMLPTISGTHLAKSLQAIFCASSIFRIYKVRYCAS